MNSLTCSLLFLTPTKSPPQLNFAINTNSAGANDATFTNLKGVYVPRPLVVIPLAIFQTMLLSIAGLLRLLEKPV
jgi:hypothetical protein